MNREDGQDFKKYLKTIFKYTFLLNSLCSGYFIVPLRSRTRNSKGIFTAFFFLRFLAFCNVGFDNLGSNSLINYATGSIFILVVAALIILGESGFLIWFDFKRSYLEMRKSTKSKKRVNHFTDVAVSYEDCPLLTGIIPTWWNGINDDYRME